MESRVSAYSSSLKVEGFGDTEEKQITFYAVDRKENIGEPITYNIIPLTPSYIEAYNTWKRTKLLEVLLYPCKILLQVTLP